MFIKDFKESYNYHQYGKGNDPDTSTVGGALGRATAGVLRMIVCKLFKLADRNEDLTISIVESYINVLFRLFLGWIVLSIILCSPDLLDLKFEVAQGVGILIALSWMISLEKDTSIKNYDEGDYKYYHRTTKERMIGTIKWVIYIAVGFGVCGLIISLFQ